MKTATCKYCKRTIYYDDTVDIWSTSKVWFYVVCDDNSGRPRRHEPAKPPHEFIPGMILRSKRSGRRWTVAFTEGKPPSEDHIPVYSSKWHNQAEFVWARADNFEKV